MCSLSMLQLWLLRSGTTLSWLARPFFQLSSMHSTHPRIGQFRRHVSQSLQGSGRIQPLDTALWRAFIQLELSLHFPPPSLRCITNFLHWTAPTAKPSTSCASGALLGYMLRHISFSFFMLRQLFRLCQLPSLDSLPLHQQRIAQPATIPKTPCCIPPETSCSLSTSLIVRSPQSSSFPLRISATISLRTQPSSQLVLSSALQPMTLQLLPMQELVNKARHLFEWCKIGMQPPIFWLFSVYRQLSRATNFLEAFRRPIWVYSVNYSGDHCPMGTRRNGIHGRSQQASNPGGILFLVNFYRFISSFCLTH